MKMEWDAGVVIPAGSEEKWMAVCHLQLPEANWEAMPRLPLHKLNQFLYSDLLDTSYQQPPLSTRVRGLMHDGKNWKRMETIAAAEKQKDILKASCYEWPLRPR